LKSKDLAETVLKLVSKDFPAKIIELKWSFLVLFLFPQLWGWQFRSCCLSCGR
jgi:hypothetical protein